MSLHVIRHLCLSSPQAYTKENMRPCLRHQSGLQGLVDDGETRLEAHVNVSIGVCLRKALSQVLLEETENVHIQRLQEPRRPRWNEKREKAFLVTCREDPALQMASCSIETKAPDSVWAMLAENPCQHSDHLAEHVCSVPGGRVLHEVHVVRGCMKEPRKVTVSKDALLASNDELRQKAMQLCVICDERHQGEIGSLLAPCGSEAWEAHRGGRRARITTPFCALWTMQTLLSSTFTGTTRLPMRCAHCSMAFCSLHRASAWRA